MIFPPVHTCKPDGPCYSPSQLDTFLQCARKWAFRYLEGVKSPPHPSAELGTRVHTQLERHLRGGSLVFTHPDGSVDESGEIAASGLPFLPDPETDPWMSLETPWLRQSTRTGLWYTGFKDLEIGSTPEFVGLVHDHKTTGNPRYALTKETLPTNIQAVLYAQEHLDKFGVDEVRLRWLYMLTKGKSRRAWPVDVTLTCEHTEREMVRVENVARQLHKLHTTRPAALSLPPNAEACEAYGGCPHRHTCNLSPVERLTSIMAKGSFLASLEASASASSAAPPSVVDELPALDPVPINPPESALPPCPLPEEEDAPAPAADPAQAELQAVIAEAKEATAKRTPRAKKADKAVEPLKAGVGAFALYINCEPVRGREATDLSTLVAKARPIVKEQSKSTEFPEGVDDYRFLQFGKGPALLSLVVSSLADECDAITMNANTPEGATCLEALAAKAAYVVRGFA